MYCSYVGPTHAQLPCAYKVLAKLQRDFVTQAITGRGRKNPLDLPARSTPLNLNFLAEKKRFENLMHKHYLLSPTLLLLAPSIPSLHLKRTSFWATLEELPFFRVLSNLNKRRSGIWILLCLIKGRDPQLSSLACSLAVCQRPVFKKDASPQDWCTVIWYIPRSISLSLGFFEKSLLGHKLAQGSAGEDVSTGSVS